jgi:bifunctional non-homologous end joining protein LigD
MDSRAATKSRAPRAPAARRTSLRSKGGDDGAEFRGELRTYQSMRDFGATPEPRGEVAEARASGLQFVIQKHAASRLHYDFRLELGGVMKSWAVPRGPSLDPAEKRLAVQTEDHPIEYNTFEGVIPEGHYGAGRVLLWDRGTWTPSGDAYEGYRKGRLRFRLDGEKLHGEWTLVRMAGGRAKGDGKDNWLLIKASDDQSRRGDDGEVTELLPLSVESQRSIDDIGPAGRRKKAEPRRRAKRLDPAELEGARKRPLPDMVLPQLATLVEQPPEGDDWLFEQKLDGYRMLCRVRNGDAQMFTRNGHDWTSKLSRCTAAVEALGIRNAWLDGELVALDASGMTSFQALQGAFNGKPHTRMHYYVFDLLYLDGYDLTDVPLVARKELLAGVLKTADEVLRYSEHVKGGGRAFHEEACRTGLEGIIGKRRDAPYVHGRSTGWVKVKCRREQEFVIAGFSEPAGTREAFGALLLGVHDQNGELRFAGRVGTGFNERLLRDLLKRLKPLERPTPAFANPPKGAAARGVHWVEPRLVAQVTFAEWTGDGIVRQASFVGLREDKASSAVTREVAAPRVEPAAAPSTSRTKASSDGAIEVASVRISNPDRVLYPEQGITKRELALYYEGIAEWLLPHLQERPVTLVRCPQGRGKACFFQKHIDERAPAALERVEIEEAGGQKEIYPVANSMAAVISLVQMGCLELHTWGSRTSLLEKPDRMIFDLDPDPGLAWGAIVDAARQLHDVLRDLGLASFVKTTGGKGLHVVVPLQRKHGWEEVKSFSHELARHLETAHPDRYTTNMSKAKRGGKIFIDYFRNARGATAVAAFSTRARPGAPVSTPLAWDELSGDLRSDHFNLRTLGARLKALREDPWAGYFASRQTLSAAMRRKLTTA